MRASLVLLVLVAWLAVPQGARATALDDYVNAADPVYSYGAPVVEYTDTVAGVPGSYTGYIFEMISQQWRSAGEVDRTTWRHWMHVVVPSNVRTGRALLFIWGEDNTAAPDSAVFPLLPLFAMYTGSVVAYVENVPNQPLRFAGETRSRTEDDLIAYGWDRYLRGGDDEWLVLLPMTKAAVRAMDTVVDFCGGLDTPVMVEDFVVTGASKRGWATWLTAAVDDRVAGCMPMVIDLLNTQRSLRHHYWAYGAWSSAVAPYANEQVFSWFGTEEMAASLGAIDPYAYRDRLTMPKYILSASGDEFFLPDSSRFYFQDLIGEKHIRYFPNSGHNVFTGLGGGTAVTDALLLYYMAMLDGASPGQFEWTMEADGSIRVATSTPGPMAVRLWQATNPAARDFRYPVLGNAGTSSVLSDQGGGIYVAEVAEPAAGWRAFFVELQYASPIPGFPYSFTTDVRVVPDVLRYAGDFTLDGGVDIRDLSLLARCWCEEGPWPLADMAPGAMGDGRVNLLDIAEFQQHWLRGR